MNRANSSLLVAAFACTVMIVGAGAAVAETAITGDPYAADPTGIVDDPCPEHPAPHADNEVMIAKLHQLTRDFGQLCRYRKENQGILASKRPVKVIFMGDSITDHWLQGDPTFFTNGRVDRGISGQTTFQMLVRFRQDVIALRPRAVHIMAGTNDIAGNTGGTTLPAVEDNIESMADLARANGIAVIIASVPPADHFDWSPAKRPASTITSLNIWLKAYAARRGFVYADYHSAMANAEGGMRGDLARDGVHPTAWGYKVMGPIAVAAIRRLLGS